MKIDFWLSAPLTDIYWGFSDITKCSKIVFFEFSSKKRASFVPLTSKSDAYSTLSLPVKICGFSSKSLFLKSELRIHIGGGGAAYKDYRRESCRSNQTEPFDLEVHKHKLWARWRAQSAPKARKWSCTHVAHTQKSKKTEKSWKSIFGCRRLLLIHTEVFSDITKWSKIAFFEFSLKKRASFVPLVSKSDVYSLPSLPVKICGFSLKINFFWNLSSESI